MDHRAVPARTGADAGPEAGSASAPVRVPVPGRYSRVAILLHWLIAALVLSTMPLGWFSTSSQGVAARPPGASAPTAVMPPPSPVAAGGGPATAKARPPSPPPKTAAQQTATNVHKTVGVVILFLTLLRIVWRLSHRPPALPATMARPLRWLARASHGMFYVLLLVMPLSGWWMSSAVPDPRRHAFGFGFVDIPFLPVAQSWPAAGAARFVHTSLVWVMAALVVLHVLAALKHHWIDKDGVLQRMLPRSFQ